MKSSVLIPAAIRGRYSDNGSIVQRLELRPDKCTNTLTSVQKDNIIVECCIDIRFSTERSEDVKDNNMPINVGNVNPSGHGMNGTVYDADGVSPTLTTNKGEGVKIRIKSPTPLHQTIIYDDYNRRIKSDQTCIGTVMPNFKNDAPGNGTKLIEVSPTPEDKITMLGGLQKHQTPRDDGICPCVNSAAGMGGGQTPIAMRQGFRVRKLTPKECWRLMGFDDEDFEKARDAMNENIYNGNDRSSSQLYKQAGNSIVVDVLQHIMENLYDAMPYLFDDMSVGSFFSGIGAFEKALSRLDTRQSENTQNGSSAELTQIGYINDYNGDANRVYDGAAIARALKAEAGGAEQRPDGTVSMLIQRNWKSVT